MQLLEVWKSLSNGRRIVAVLSSLAIFLAIFGMARLASTPSMTLLYAGLESGAAGEVVRSLEARGVPFEVRGSSIFVASSDRDQLRMTLASEGLPANGASGYELLDNLSGFGTTSQMFDAAYWRAKEGELARTIVASPHIASARVHIATSRTSAFQRGVEPTASVAIKPSGGTINAAQAKSLKFLVASAVAGLSPDNVAIIGTDGALLGLNEDPATTPASEDKATGMREKVQRLLEARVGAGNAVVEVSVDTVTERESIRERRFDPESRVAISTDTEERNNSSNRAAGGDVTVASNLPDGDAEGGGEGASSENTETRERVNYEVSETEREILRAPGSIKRVTVAVLVNGVSSTAEDGTTSLEPRSEEELGDLRELVSSAVGFDEARGDVITIKSMGLQSVEPQGTVVTSSLLDTFAIDWMAAIQMAVLAIVTLILGLFVVRPLLMSKPQSAATTPPALAGETAGEGAISLPNMTDGGIDEGRATASGSVDADGPIALAGVPEDPVERLRNLIGERQEETVQILQGWLEDEEEPVR